MDCKKSWVKAATISTKGSEVDCLNGKPIVDRVWYKVKFPNGTEEKLQTRVVTEVFVSAPTEGNLVIGGTVLNRTKAMFAFPHKGIAEVWFRAIDVEIEVEVPEVWR